MQRDEFQAKSFPDLSGIQAQRSPGRSLRVCIATEEIFGPVRNGGIASTYYHLARTLVADGHTVTVLYLKGTKCENETVEYWIEFYRRLDVRFVPMPAEPLELVCPSPRWQRQMYEFHRWLKSEEPFDIVHTSEWRGGAYYALLAKRLGLAFERTLFVVKTSSPYIWNRHYRMLPLGNKAELARMYPERRVVELADIVVGGSAHLLTFVEQKGYHLPAGRTFVQPNIIDLQDLNVEERRPRYRYGDLVKTRELVFFGRLEARKGLDIFCEAITRIAELGMRPQKITFLGKQGERLPAHPGETSIEFIQRQAKTWPFPVEIIDSYDQDKAIGYLCASPRIAVMPSVIENSTMTVYECLVHKIPFLATAVGGTPELIAERYHDRVLIEAHPESLTTALQRVLLEGGTIAEGAFDYKGNLVVWRGFHRYLAVALGEKTVNEVVADIGEQHHGEDGLRLRTTEANAASPAGSAEAAAQDDSQVGLRVSVCIYYHQRPQFLEVLLESLLVQDCEVEEVIIMNDGPLSEDVPGILEHIEERFGSLGWKILEQPHRCIGPALNAAASRAGGDLLVFLNAEHHYCEPGLIGVFRRAASESPAAAFTCFHALFENQKPGQGGNDDIRVVPLGGDLATGFYEDGVFGGSCFAVRRAVFLKMGGFYEGYHLGGIEQEFHARLVLAGYELDVVPEVLYWERRVASITPFNSRSKEYLAIRPFLQSAPYYLENIMLTARMLARKVEHAETEINYHRGELAMHRGDWSLASERWGEMRRTFPNHAAGFIRGATSLMRAGRLDEADAVAEEAVSRFPDRPEGYVQRAEAAMRREDWAAASERWAELRRAFPEHASGYLRGAEALLEAGRLDEADAVAEEAVSRFPDRPGGYVQRAEVAMRRGDWAGACERWAELRRAFPEHASGYLRGAEALLEAGRLDETEAVASEAVSRFPDRPGGYVQRAEAAMRREDWAGASERWAELRRVSPERASGYLRGAEALLEAGRLDETEAVASEAVSRFPDRPGGYVQRAEAAMRRGDWAGASERWAELRRVSPERASGYLRGAEALLEAGRLDETEAVASEAVSRFPDRPGGYVQRAEVAMRREDWAAGSERWAELRRAFPEHASGYLRGAEALLEAGRLDETEAVASEAVSRFPDRPGGYVQRAEAAMRRGDWAAASERWAELRRVSPERASGYLRGAEALLEAGRLDEAEAVVSESVSRFPDRPGGYVQRAEAAMRREDWAAGSERWAELRRAFPEHASGYLRGAEALLEAGRLDETEAVASEAVSRFPDRPGGYVQRAEAAMRRGDWAAASERWAELRRVSPERASGYLRGAEALLEAGRLDETEAVASEAVSRFPDRPGGYVQRAEVAMRREDWAGASERWAELRQAFPEHASGYLRGAEALLEAGRLDETEAVASEAVSRFPDRPGGYVQRAEAAMRREDWAGASERWAELRRVSPERASGYLRGAEALLEAGRLDEAEALAGEAAKRFPNHPGGHYRRAEFAMRRRDREAARGSWSEMCRALAENAAGHVRGVTLVRPRSWFGVGNLHASILLDPGWGAQASQRRDRGPILELRRNGKAVAQAFAKDLSHDVAQFAAGPRIPAHGEVLYSVHDALSGEVLAALAAPAFLRGRQVVGSVENRPRPEIRGWLLDQGEPERRGRVAVHVDGRLREVIDADNQRTDIARWKGTDGRHGFRWPLPDELAVKDGTRIDVFDADTGRPLRGSPVRIESGRAVVSGRRRT